MCRISLMVFLPFALVFLFACTPTPGKKLNEMMKKQVELLEGDDWKSDILEWCSKNGDEMERLVDLLDADDSSMKDFDQDYFEDTYRPLVDKRLGDRELSREDKRDLKSCFVP